MLAEHVEVYKAISSNGEICVATELKKFQQKLISHLGMNLLLLPSVDGKLKYPDEKSYTIGKS